MLMMTGQGWYKCLFAGISRLDQWRRKYLLATVSVALARILLVCWWTLNTAFESSNTTLVIGGIKSISQHFQWHQRVTCSDSRLSGPESSHSRGGNLLPFRQRPPLPAYCFRFYIWMILFPGIRDTAIHLNNDENVVSWPQPGYSCPIFMRSRGKHKEPDVIKETSPRFGDHRYTLRGNKAG